MAIVTIKLSQGVVNQEHAMAGDIPVLGADPGSLIDFFAGAAATIEEDYQHFTSWSLLGSTLRTTYADGAVGVYSGLVLEPRNAMQGSASVAAFDFTKAGLIDLGVTGKFSYDYDMSNGGLSFEPSAAPMTINGLHVATRLPVTSPDYDPAIGNISMGMRGDIQLLPSGELRGKIGHVDLTADKFIRSITLDGDFQVVNTMVDGHPGSALEGTLASFNATFEDGSLIDVRNAASFLQPGASLGQGLLAGTSERDEFTIELPSVVYEDMIVGAGAGDDLIVLKGGGGRLKAAAGDGNDVLRLLGDAHDADGGRGIDVVQLAGSMADYAIKSLPVTTNPDPRYPKLSFFSITDKSGSTSTVINFERIVFDNATLALDIDGNAGQAYRLYKAVFNRAPDAVGLGFWINSLDKGVSLLEVSKAFMTTDEYKGLYGGSQSNLELVTRFYQNILGREPEPTGRDFWVRNLDAGVTGVADVMAAISESAENKDGLATIVGNGFTYTPWTGG